MGIPHRAENKEIDPNAYRVSTYFNRLTISIHICSGGTATGGRHIEVTKNPQQRRIIHLKASDDTTYNGDFLEYARDFFSLEKKEDNGHPCWRALNGELLCAGIRKDHREIVASLPVVLNVEIDSPSAWNLPATFTPDDTQTDVIYELVGLVLYSESHFRARYLSSNKAHVCTYDGMWKDGAISGVPRIEQDTIAGTHFHGPNMKLQAGWRVCHTLYMLKGGIKTQEKFFQHRISKLSARYSLDFKDPTLGSAIDVSLNHSELVKMPSEERYWIKHPLSYHTHEYLPKKGVPGDTFHNQTTRPPPIISAGPEAETPRYSKKLRPPPEFLPLEPIEGVSRKEKLAQLIIQKIADEKKRSIDSEGNQDQDSVKAPIMRCRCGIEGNVQVVHKAHDGEISKCENCETFSHRACQSTDVAENLFVGRCFTCNRCAPPKLGPLSTPTKS